MRIHAKPHTIKEKKTEEKSKIRKCTYIDMAKDHSESRRGGGVLY